MNLKRKGMTINQRSIERYFELVNLTTEQVQTLSHHLTQLSINYSEISDRYLHQLRTKTRFSHPDVQNCLSYDPLCNAIKHHIQTWLTCSYTQKSFNYHVRLVTELNAHHVTVAEFLLCGLAVKANLLSQLKRSLHTLHIDSARLSRDFEKWLTVNEHILRDLELNHQLEQLRQATSFKDELTNVYSYAVFLEELDRAVALCDRTDQSLTVVHFDINQLNTINHQHGFQVGDAVLQQFASVCTEQLRKTETIARDDDEFFILLPNAPLKEARKVFSRLVELFDNATEIPVTLTAGASVYQPDSDLTLEQVLERTRTQLARAKTRSSSTGTHQCCLDIDNKADNVLHFAR
ncbi:GGDEF domain-containing protein [Vibrio fortis]|nr:GGDEF domain-containing protein [Vibrio fortis]